jgi:NitT/TauT family transport system ATP-binding protein
MTVMNRVLKPTARDLATAGRAGTTDRKASGMTEVRVEGLQVAYDTGPGVQLVACDDVNLTVAPGEFVTIIGPSGCGKSTVLHCMGGLLKPSKGRVLFGGEEVTQPNPHNAAFVFQDYSLFPWKNIRENVGMGLKFSGASKAEIAEKSAEKLDFVGLSDFSHALPRELSGGMQQRVAIARALAMEPRVLLMDEPFGALDEQSRRSLGSDMARILGQTQQSVVLITHSLDEAIFWADRIIVMSSRPGTILEEIEVKAPRPRDLSMMTEPEFQAIRVRLFDLIQLQQTRSPQAAAPGR